MKNKLTLSLLVSIIFLVLTITYARSITFCDDTLEGSSNSISPSCDPQSENDCIYPINGGYTNLRSVGFSGEGYVRFNKVGTGETKTCRQNYGSSSCKNPFVSVPTKVTIYPNSTSPEIVYIVCDGRCTVLLNKKVCF